MKGVENTVHNVSKEKETTIFVKKNRVKETEKLLPIETIDEIKVTSPDVSK